MKCTVFGAVVVALISPDALAAEVQTAGAGAIGLPSVAVVYGEVVSVSKVKPRQVHVTLNVKCTLTGPFDAAACPVLEAAMDLGGPLDWAMGGVTREPPKPKARVVAILWSHPAPFFIPWGIPLRDLGYAPSGEGIVEVSGFEDPKVAQIIARLREVRAANRPGAAKAQKRGREAKTKADD